MIKNYRLLPDKITDEMLVTNKSNNAALIHGTIFTIVDRFQPDCYKSISSEYDSVGIDTTGLAIGCNDDAWVSVEELNNIYNEEIPKLLALGIIEEFE